MPGELAAIFANTNGYLHHGILSKVLPQAQAAAIRALLGSQGVTSLCLHYHIAWNNAHSQMPRGRVDPALATSLPSAPQPKPIPRQPNINKLTRISATISSRVLSFQEWPHINITPTTAGKARFYHQPCHKRRDNAHCFTCEWEASQWGSVRPYTTEELLEQHEEGEAKPRGGGVDGSLRWEMH